MTTPLIIDLPLPPSTNNLYYNVQGKGRVKSREYRKWQESVVLRFRNIGWFEDAVSVHIRVPHDRRRDIDNYAKPILDALVNHGVIRDDRYVDYLTVEKSKVQEKKMCNVQVWAV